MENLIKQRSQEPVILLDVCKIRKFINPNSSRKPKPIKNHFTWSKSSLISLKSKSKSTNKSNNQIVKKSNILL